MDKIKFANGSEYETITTMSDKKYVQGVTREVLEVQFPKGVITLDALDALTSNKDNLNKIVLFTTGDKPSEFIHTDYCIRTELAVKSITIAPETSTELAKTEERICVSIAQLTYAEKHQQEMQMQIDSLMLSGLGVK